MIKEFFLKIMIALGFLSPAVPSSVAEKLPEVSATSSLEKQVQSPETSVLPKIEAKEVVKTGAITPVVTTSSISKEQTVQTENFNYLVVELNESLTSSFESSLNKNLELKTILQSRKEKSSNLSREFRSNVIESVPVGVNIPNDLYRALSEYKQQDSVTLDILIAQNNSLINGLNKIIKELRDFKTKDSVRHYTKEESVLKMKEMMKVYDTLESVNKMTNEVYAKYVKSSESSDLVVNQAVAALKKNSDEYLYQPLLGEVIIPIQRISFPKIEFPKTTYCNVSYTGIHGNYDVVCN